MTFDPHPSVVLNPERKRTTYLTPLSDKLEMIEHHDVDYCIVINFLLVLLASLLKNLFKNM